ncbi:MAG: polyphosphate kinase 2 [Qingshengfaniella sp.]
MSKPEDLPYDGAITRFFEEEAEAAIRKAIKAAPTDPILGPGYPHAKRLARSPYEDTLRQLQVELAKFQGWVQKSGARVVILFEGRDAAGKGGTIKRFRENMNPRIAQVVALAKPNEVEASQWYFQRYAAHLPAAGQIMMFDRSWYNRAVVEHVFGFCDHAQRERFFHQAPGFEQALVADGVHLIKIWLNVNRAEQLRRFLDREGDPLKQWKLSTIDIEGLRRWDAYSVAIRETFERTHTDPTPWTVIRADDKRRARIAAIRTVLSQIPYDGRRAKIACPPDPLITGGPEIWDG